MADPRFDPAFQRGYSGPAPRLGVRATRDTAAPMPPVEIVEITTPPLDPPVAADVGPSTENLDDTEPDAVPERPRRNPFGLALLVGGALLILLGVGMIWKAANTVIDYSGNSVSDSGQQALFFLTYSLPPAFLLSGILGILGWLVLGALRSPAPVDD